MSKRGQVTIFIILGIIIIVAIVFGISMRKQITKAVTGEETSEALSFTEQSQMVKEHVEDCLKEALVDAKDSMPPVNIAPEEYNDGLTRATKERAVACLNFRQFGGLEIAEQSKDMAVEITRNSKLTAITATAQFELVITQGENTQRYKTFEVSLDNTVPVGEVA